jgi:hypothetical protein
MAIKHIILLFVETRNFFVLKARRRAGRVVDRKLPTVMQVYCSLPEIWDKMATDMRTLTKYGGQILL